MYRTDDGDLVIRPRIDTRLGEYRLFFDHAWAKEFGEATDDTKLTEAGMYLMRDWKGAGGISVMPWLMVQSLKGFHSGFTQGNPPFWRRLADKFGHWLVTDGGLSDIQKNRLKTKVGDLGAQVESDMLRAGPAFDVGAAWQDYLAIPQFVLTLWNSQRICYAAVYFGYENFVRNCIAVGQGAESYEKTSHTELCKDFTKLLGNDLAIECLDDLCIRVARESRHRLAHNGGTVSPRLRDLAHDLDISDGDIHIKPENVRRLFDVLKTRAMKIALRAKELPSFANRRVE